MIIKQSVDGAIRMEELIKDLLAYTGISVAPIEALQSVSLNQVFDSTLEVLRAAISETSASITRACLPDSKVEAVHLRQILQNLMGNALKYRSDRLPVIHVDARQEAQEWVISVADNGIGIAPDYKDQIFGLFKRLHNRERYARTGLGLAICKKLLERYGGRIWVESEPGKGSTFFFTLPAADEPELITRVSKGGRECSMV